MGFVDDVKLALEERGFVANFLGDTHPAQVEDEVHQGDFALRCAIKSVVVVTYPVYPTELPLLGLVFVLAGSFVDGVDRIVRLEKLRAGIVGFAFEGRREAGEVFLDLVLKRFERHEVVGVPERRGYTHADQRLS